MPDVPHLGFPLRLGADGDLACVEQDSYEDVRSCVHVLLRTPRGVRPLAPQVGVEDPTFHGVDADELAAELEAQEDRARVVVTAASVDASGEQQVTVEVGLADDDEPEEAIA